jgi:hypothetical protein
MSDSGGGASCSGCLAVILFIILIWALVFGVTIGGKHYGISCSCAKGVEVE